MVEVKSGDQIFEEIYQEYRKTGGLMNGVIFKLKAQLKMLKKRWIFTSDKKDQWTH